MLITSLEYSSYIGRVAIGRVHRGSVSQDKTLCDETRWWSDRKEQDQGTLCVRRFDKQKAEEVTAGEICCFGWIGRV